MYLFRAVSYWLRLALAWTLALRVVAGAGAPQSCTVEEQQQWRVVTGRFSAGSRTVTVTMPSIVRRATTVFMETSATGADKLFMQSGSELVAVENGAALHLEPRAGERLMLALVSESGQRLCEWQPSLFSQKTGRQANLANGFPRSEAYHFRKTGDPILLTIGPDLADFRGEFRIGGLPAMVLARNAAQVILRDPAPAVGSRVLTARGDSLTLRFVQVEVRLSKAALTVRVPRLDLWGRHLWPFHAHRYLDASAPQLLLVNDTPDRIRLLCGRDVPTVLGLDFDQARGIRITQEMVRNGALTVSCRVRVLKQGPARVYPLLFETPFGAASRSAFPE